MTTIHPSPRNRELLEQSRTACFKSRAPKTSIYLKEEKRIRQLYGPKNNLKYQIKLNDVILDRAKNSVDGRGKSASPGKLVLGPNFGEERIPVPESERERNSDLFSIKKLNSLGPQDYDPNPVSKTSPAATIKEPTVLPQGVGSVKK